MTRKCNEKMDKIGRLKMLESDINHDVLKLKKTDSSSALFQSAFFDIAGKIYKYTIQLYYNEFHEKTAINNNTLIDKPNDKIWKTIKKCLSNYNPNLKPFMNYYNSSIVKIVNEAKENNKKNSKTKKTIIEYIKDSEKKGEQISKNDIFDFALRRGIDTDIVRQILEGDIGYESIDEQLEHCNSESAILTQYIEGPERRVVSESEMNEIIDSVSKAFIECQERQKSLLSAMITTRILDMCIEYPSLMEYVRKQPFFCEPVYDYFLNTKKTFPDYLIAEMEKRNPQSASKAYKAYKDKILRIMHLRT